MSIRSSQLASCARWLCAVLVTSQAPAFADDGLDGLLDPAALEAAPEGAQNGEAGAPGPSGSDGGARVTDPTPGPAESRLVEEVIVTAQKIEQALSDVPISMTVLSAAFLEEQNVTDFVDLTPFVPNGRVNTGAAGANDIRLRGFGSTYVNKAFEQPVGLVVDGIPYGRLPYFFVSLFDLERIEVLRGPQGTLVGKNTTAGAFNVTTRAPTDDLAADARVEIGDFGLRRIVSGVGGPLVAGFVNARVAGFTEDRDGYLRNTTAELRPEPLAVGPVRSRHGIRACLDFPDLFGATLGVGYERVELDDTGEPSEIRQANAIWIDFQRQFDPEFDAVPYNGVNSIFADVYTRQDIDTFMADLAYDVAGWDTHLLAGYSMLRSVGQTAFPAASPSFVISAWDDNPQTTVELRTSSPPLPGLFGLDLPFVGTPGATRLLTGFFFQRRVLTGASLAVFQGAFYGADAGIANAGSLGVGGLPIPVPSILSEVPAEGPPEDLVIAFDQTSTSLAGFAHASWALGRATLEYGMRLTHETKDGHWDIDNPRPGPLVLALTQGGFSKDSDLSELAFTPKVSLLYDWTDTIATYAFWAKGFKSGGFNEFAFHESGATTVSAEETSDWEVGAKTRLLDGSLVLNVGLFRQNVRNLQVFQTITFPPTGRATNAGRARSQGVEIDAIALPTEWLNVVGAFGYDDARFLEYPLGGCTSDNRDSDGNGDGFCDLSGRQLEKAPRWTATLVPGVTVPVASLLDVAAMPLLRSLDLTGSLKVEYQDVHKLDFGLDPRSRQPAFFRLGATLGLEHAGQGWALGVSGENLNDAEVSSFVVEVFGPGNFKQTPLPPRMVFGWFRWSF